MYKIDWNTFKLKNENSTKSFEDLCYHLFCRTHKFAEGIKADFNHAGLETYPQKSNVNKKNVGFQSKFFEYNADYKQIKASVVKAIERHENHLDEITIYLNTDSKISSTSAKQINHLADQRKIKINWFTKDQFKIALNEPLNLDLAQLYFGLGDEYGFVKHNISLYDSNFIQSNQILKLPVRNLSTNTKEDINLLDKLILLTGNPCSGKSILVKKMFFDQSKIGESIVSFKKNAFLPMLINLRDCYSDSLENIVRNRQNDYNIWKTNFKFVYIFDGLDELSEIQAEIILQYAKNLSGQSNTANIIISCRKGSLNRLKLSQYFENFQRYEVDNLEIKHIETYFIGKANVGRLNKLNIIKKTNPKLLQEINDVFLVKLFWDTIEELNEDSTVFDILEFKIFSQLKSSDHKNNLEDLNLLNPKENHILKLNEVFSYQFSKKYQYRFPHTSLIKIVEDQFNKLDYKSINQILNYNSNAFFDTSEQDPNQSEVSYIYQHRRYQEYFFARALKKRFEKDIKIIRSNGVILNPDFFDEIFIKYLEKEYKKANDLAGLVLLKSLEFYQKNSDQWYILESDHFVDSLTYQTEKNLEILLNDDILNIKSFVLANYKNSLKYFENGLDNLANDLIKITKKKEFDFKELEAYLFYKIVIEKSNRYKDYLLSTFRDYYKGLSYVQIIVEQQNHRDFAIQCFLKVGLKHNLNDVVLLVKDLNHEEMTCLLDLLLENEFLPLLFKNIVFQKEIKNKIKTFRRKPHLDNVSFYFFKKIFNLNISPSQITQMTQVLTLLTEKLSSYSLVKFLKPLSLLYNLIGEEIFKNSVGVHNFDTRGITKYANLQDAYLKILQNEDSFSKHLADYSNRFGSWYPSEEKFVHKISSLWSYIFYYSNADNRDYHQMNKILKRDFNAFIFLEFLNKIDREYFSKTIYESDLEVFEKQLQSWKNDYPRFIDQSFLLSGMFSRINPKKSISFIRKGFTNNYLRHGWRKDIFVSHFLNDSFGKIIDKRWFSRSEIIQISEKLFKLNLRLYNVTDKDHTRYGISEFLDSLSRYDTKLAYKYLKKYKKLNLDWYVENIALTDILINDIQNNGRNYTFIKNKTDEYTLHYNYTDRPPKEYYEQIFRIEMEVLKSDFYVEKVKYSAFQKAFEIVEKVEGSFSYQKRIIDDYYDLYNSYCVKNNKQNLIKSEESEYFYINVSEETFLTKIENVKNSTELNKLYKFYHDSLKNKIEIKDKNIWKKLIDKTYILNGNINLFVDLVRKFGYLLTGFGDSYNSEYLHLGIAYSLENVNTKNEMQTFLIDNAGYGGFYKMVYIYAELNDKKTTLKLFHKFYSFCDFLLN